MSSYPPELPPGWLLQPQRTMPGVVVAVLAADPGIFTLPGAEAEVIAFAWELQGHIDAGYAEVLRRVPPDPVPQVSFLGQVGGAAPAQRLLPVRWRQRAQGRAEALRRHARLLRRRR